MSAVVRVPRSIIEATVNELRMVGQRDSECVVLWLGARQADHIDVRELFIPIQDARSDYFHIPRNGMEALLDHLRGTRLMVAAQVHSHPEEAFHSWADDKWALVRHVGALSLVVPYFCQSTDAGSFRDDTRVFQLTDDGAFMDVTDRAAYVVLG